MKKVLNEKLMFNVAFDRLSQQPTIPPTELVEGKDLQNSLFKTKNHAELTFFIFSFSFLI